ncbi:dUTP diphosphatase [Methyloversatilis sp.]|uniref:dUTP diphosphatase n=1 Tax=Methyloversatilis sp. TaxID=2569862 RepID=UPI0035B4EC45
MLNFRFIKLTETAQVPRNSTPHSIGFDVFADNEEPITVRAGEAAVMIPTGLKIEMQSGIEEVYGPGWTNTSFAALMLPRSGLGHKKGLVLGNGVGLIDPDYQGEWMVSVVNRGNGDKTEDIVINRGDRIAQVIFVPAVRPSFLQVEQFADVSERGQGGFGSTGISAELSEVLQNASDELAKAAE